MKPLITSGLCIVCGLLIALVVTFLCHVFRFRPAQFFMDLDLCYPIEVLAHDAGNDPWIAKMTPEVEVVSDHGIGFRRTEIRQRPDPQAPKAFTRHFFTTLGWPQPILSTGSEWLGRFHGADLPSWDHDKSVLEDTPMTDGPATTLHWSGIIFDAATFGLPLLALAMWASRPGGRSITLLRCATFVLAASWWMSLVIPAVGVFDHFYSPNIPPPPMGQTFTHPNSHLTWWVQSPAEFAQRTGFAPMQLDPEEWKSFSGSESSSFAVCFREQTYLKPHPKFPTKADIGVRGGQSVSAGWPMLSFSKGDSTYGIFSVSDLSHLDVQWLPWLANVSVFSSILSCACSLFLLPNLSARLFPWLMNGAALIAMLTGAVFVVNLVWYQPLLSESLPWLAGVIVLAAMFTAVSYMGILYRNITALGVSPMNGRPHDGSSTNVDVVEQSLPQRLALWRLRSDVLLSEAIAARRLWLTALLAVVVSIFSLPFLFGQCPPEWGRWVAFVVCVGVDLFAARYMRRHHRAMIAVNKDKRACIYCNYSLANLPAPGECPECGRPFPEDAYESYWSKHAAPVWGIKSST